MRLRKLSRLSAITIILVLLGAGLPQAGHASSVGPIPPTWAAPIVLASGDIDVDSVELSSPSTDPAIAAWRVLDQGIWRVQASRRLTARTWSAPVFLSSAGVPTEDPSVGGSYSRTVAWREFDGTHWLVRVSVLTAKHGWSAPTTISDATHDAADAIVVGENPQDRSSTGYKLILWRELQDGHWLVKSGAVTRTGQLVGTVTTVSQPGQDARDLRLGAAGIVWSRFDGTNWRAQTAGGSFPSPELVQSVSPPGEDALDPDLPTIGTAVWRASDGTHLRIRVAEATDPQAGTWASPISISPPDQDVAAFSAAHGPLDQQKSLVIAWRQHDGANWRVSVAERRAEGWSPTVYVSTQGRDATAPDTASTYFQFPYRTGPGTQVAWTEHDGASRVATVATYLGTTPPTTTVLSKTGSDVTSVRLLNANAVAWTEGAGPATTLTLRGFDTSAPSSRVSGIPSISMQVRQSARLRWADYDDWSEIANHDLRRRVTGWRTTRLPPRKLILSDTTAPSFTTRFRPGRTYCFESRARDVTGKQGPWSNLPKCLVTPLDDRSLRASNAWQRKTGHGYVAGTYLETRQHGAVLTLNNLTRIQSLGVVVATGPGQGRIRVTFRGDFTRSKVVDLASAKPHKRMVRSLINRFCCPSQAHGRLVITVLSHGKPVRIDGAFVGKQTLS